MNNLSFENFSAVFLLLLPIFIWLVGFYFLLRKRKNLTNILGEKAFTFLSSSLSTKKREWKRVLECLALFFFILAFLRPQWGKSVQKITNHGVEIMILFDVSKSMLAEDVKPSRLEFSKREVRRFLDLSYGHKIGLMAFAGSAVVLSPMTTDYSALKMYIDSLSPHSVSSQGTDFQKALLESERAFQRGGIEKTHQHLVTRVLLIVSDGEDNAKGALEAAQELEEKENHIFSLLVGTRRGAPISFRDSTGEVQGFQKDSSGQTVLTKAQDDLLRRLALKGGGSFYHLTYGGKAIQQVWEDIEVLQKTEFESAIKVNYEERYHLFLLLGLIVALLELLLPERSFSRKKWKGRFLVSLFLFFSFSCVFTFDPLKWQVLTSEASLRMIYKNNKGAKALIKNKPEEARRIFLEGLKKHPFNPLLHFNLALTFEQSQETEKALQQYKTTLRILDEIGLSRNKFKEEEKEEEKGGKEKIDQQQQTQKMVEDSKSKHPLLEQIRFNTLFNLARLLSEEKEIDQALSFYQQSLNIHPQSKEVKTNIELLWQQPSAQQKNKDNQEAKENQKDNENQETESQETNQKNEHQEDESQEGEDQENENQEGEDQKNESGEEDTQAQEPKEKDKEKEDKNNQGDSSKKRGEKPPKEQKGNQPSPFQGKSLTEEDISRILEEIKDQEQKIRAKELSKGKKEKSHEKDW